MPWTLKFISDHNMIETVYTDIVNLEDVKEQVPRCFTMAKEMNTYRFLVDASQADLKLSVVDILDIPDIYGESSIQKPVIKAVVVPATPEGKKVGDFYERACLSHGWSVKVFSERQEAIDWLLKY